MEDYPDDFLSLIQPGKKVQRYYGDGHIANRDIVIVGIIDYPPVVVYKTYSRRLGYIYSVERMSLLYYAYQSGRLMKSGRHNRITTESSPGTNVESPLKKNILEPMRLTNIDK